MTLTPGMKVHRMDMTLACMQEWFKNHNSNLELSISLKTIIILKNFTNLKVFWYQHKHYLNKKNHGTDQNRKLLVKKLQVVLRDRFPTRASLEKYVTHNSYEYNNEIYSLSLPVWHMAHMIWVIPSDLLRQLVQY